VDGGIDLALSRIVFPGIETKVKQIVRDLGKVSLVGKPYLPIGSSIIIQSPDPKNNHKHLVVAPTMLLPQNVANTNNAYYATMAILFNVLVNCGQDLREVDILFTSLCCGYGRMDEDKSIQQILDGIRDFNSYKPQYITLHPCPVVLCEPNLWDQPKLYQNTEFFSIPPADIVHC